MLFCQLACRRWVCSPQSSDRRTAETGQLSAASSGSRAADSPERLGAPSIRAPACHHISSSEYKSRFSVSWSRWSAPLLWSFLSAGVVDGATFCQSLDFISVEGLVAFVLVLSENILMTFELRGWCRESRGEDPAHNHVELQCWVSRMGEWWVPSLTVCVRFVRKSLIHLHVCWLTPNSLCHQMVPKQKY